MQEQLALAAGRPNPIGKRLFGGLRVVTLACDGCGVSYLDYAKRAASAKRHFCSASCYHKSKRGHLNPHWRGGNLKRVCVVCSTEFEVVPAAIKHRRSDFCSVACKAAGTRIYPNAKIAHREHGRRREARERAGGRIQSHTYAEWAALIARAKHRCVKCRKKRALTRDHIIPLSKGGHDGITNIQPLCRPCNTAKHNRLEQLL